MAFTPDSRELVASYGGRIWRVPVDGGAPPQVPFRVDVDVGRSGRCWSSTTPSRTRPPSWAAQIRDAVPSPDGGAAGLHRAGPALRDGLPDGTPRRLADEGWQGQAAAHLVAGRALDRVRDVELRGGGHLYRVRADGRGGPSGSPAGRRSTSSPPGRPTASGSWRVRGPARAFEEALTQACRRAAAGPRLGPGRGRRGDAHRPRRGAGEPPLHPRPGAASSPSPERRADLDALGRHRPSRRT